MKTAVLIKKILVLTWLMLFLFQRHENLEVKKGDASDGKTFSEFLAGKDAVLSALGARSGRFANITLYSQTMREIHEAMKR